VFDGRSVWGREKRIKREPHGKKEVGWTKKGLVEKRGPLTDVGKWLCARQRLGWENNRKKMEVKKHIAGRKELEGFKKGMVGYAER